MELGRKNLSNYCFFSLPFEMLQLLLLVVLIFDVFLVDTYYFDDAKIKEIKGKSNVSLFGYALATYQDKNASISLLVGSPGSNDYQGELFQCYNDFSKPCNSIRVSRSPGTRWLGATIVTKNEIIMVCAPRTEYKKTPSSGECFYRMKANESDFKPISTPLMNREDYESRYGNNGVDIKNLVFHRALCLTGIAAAIITDNSSTKFASSSPSCANYKNELPKSFSTGIWIADGRSDYVALYRPDDFSMYFGYALAIGMYCKGIEKSQFLAVSIGSHFNSDFAGRVNIYDTSNLKKEMLHINGYQPGEYFGASVTAVDLNGDGLDDIVIGAPFFTSFSNSEVKHDIGAVYTFLQQRITNPQNSANNQLFKPVRRLFGKNISGRFGYTVAGIGDIDGDGYNEVAIGAPYDDDGTGAIYIYHGFKNGIRKEYGETIKAKNFKTSTSMRMFGSAIASGDFDKNGFIDLVVGSPLSNVVVFLPAKPVIDVKLRDFVFYPAEMMIKNGNPQTYYEHTKLKYCVSITNAESIKYENVLLSIDIKLEPDLAKTYKGKSHHRLEFAENNLPNLTDNVTLPLLKEHCAEKNILFTAKKLLRDDPITAEIMFAVQPLDEDGKLVPIVNASSVRHQSSVLKLQYVRDEKLPWWAYLLCTLGAAIVISVIIGALKKLGFFKRTRPPYSTFSSPDKNSTSKISNEEQS